jgi:peptidoglycan L-alanyl-D-glutamate endopeptidase CwlK
MKAAAKAEKVPLEWGGDWKFKDGPHFQLPWATHPGTNKGAKK